MAECEVVMRIDDEKQIYIVSIFNTSINSEIRRFNTSYEARYFFDSIKHINQGRIIYCK
jgi:hypothetical protein